MRVSSPALVGRGDEVAQLRAALDRARSGAPTTVVVAGEAGVGKTRLTGDLIEHARSVDVRTLTGGCLDIGDGVVAYAPIVEALRSLTATLEPAELDRVLGGSRGELTRLVPELGGAVDPAGALPPGRLFELLLGVLHRLAEDRAVLLVAEDVHWADESTRHLLGFLVRNLRGPVALVLTYRSDELHRRHPLRPFLAELERSGRAERLDLVRLDRGALADLLRGILGEAPAAALVDEILARSEGNPFFAEELVAARVEGVQLPEALRDVLLARVERLPDETQRVLQVAAVAGRQVDHGLLAEVAGLPPERLVELLRDAVTHHVLVVQDGGRAYAFRHALVQEAIYDDLLPMQRVPLHAACARTLATTTAPPDGRGPAAGSAAVLGQLAYHWSAAHDLDEALLASVRAGQAAEAAAAVPEAQHHYQRALELWEQAPDAAARSPLDRQAVLIRAAQTMSLVGDARGAVTLIGQALSETDPTAEPLVTSTLLEQLAAHHWRDGDSAAAMAAAERAVAMVPAEPPTLERARALAVHGRMLMLHSRCEAAQALCEEAVVVARQVGDRAVEGLTLNTAGVALGCRGHLDAGVDHLEQAHRIADELGDVESVCRARLNLSSILTHNGRCDDAVRVAQECYDLAVRIGARRTYGVTGQANAAEALMFLGRWDEAGQLLDAMFDLDLPSASVPPPLIQRGRLRLGRGDLAAAWADATASESAHRALDPQEAAPTLSLLAAVATWDGRLEDARAAAARGIALLVGIDQADHMLLVCEAGLDAEAAIAERALARRDTAAVEEATAVAADLIQRARDISAAEGIAMTGPGRGWLLTSEAHLSRVHGRSDPDRWAAAAAAWAEIAYPWQAALARWRQAEALLAAGAPRDQAAGPLREAWVAANGLGARLLTAEVEGLARRARIPLDPPPAAGPRGDTATREAAEAAAPGTPRGPRSDAGADLGLTPREREVLELVAEGRTNRQIAEALYISDKTASVHVSNILAKLQVANRAEAAVAAHRLGLGRTRGTAAST